jgi:hypothetical protein
VDEVIGTQKAEFGTQQALARSLSSADAAARGWQTEGRERVGDHQGPGCEPVERGRSAAE